MAGTQNKINNTVFDHHLLNNPVQNDGLREHDYYSGDDQQDNDKREPDGTQSYFNKISILQFNVQHGFSESPHDGQSGIRGEIQCKQKSKR